MNNTSIITSHHQKLHFAGHSKKYPNLPLALDELGLSHLQEPIDRPFGIDSWQWIQCLSGSGTLQINGHSYLVSKGCGMLIPNGYSHVYFDNGNNWYVNFLCCGGALIQEITSQLNLQTPGAYRLLHPEKILDYEKTIADLYLRNDLDCHLALSKLLYQLMIDLSQDIHMAHAGQPFPQNEKIHNAIRFIQEHFTENISLSDIANSVNLSKEYLCHIFKQHTGSTLLEYLTETRLSEAKVLLMAYPNKTVGEIAQHCGFDSPSYFCSVFKKHVHMTPLQFSHR